MGLFVCVYKSDGLSACLFVKVKGHESCNDTIIASIFHSPKIPLKKNHLHIFRDSTYRVCWEAALQDRDVA